MRLQYEERAQMEIEGKMAEFGVLNKKGLRGRRAYHSHTDMMQRMEGDLGEQAPRAQ